MLGAGRGVRLPPCTLRVAVLHHSRRTSSAFALRPYQESCLLACLDTLESGTRRIGVSLPTGSGKTAVFTALLSRLESKCTDPDVKGSLVIVSSIELALQTAALARRMRPDWNVEIEQGVAHHASGAADLTVATYQTLLRQQRLDKFDPARIRAVVVDEAHHAASPSYLRILAHFNKKVRLDNSTHRVASSMSYSVRPQDVPIIGFSATFNRHDGLALGSVFERVVFHRDLFQMIEEQWLSDVCLTTVRADINLKDVTINSRSGDFNATRLAHIINTETINKLIVQSWMEKASERKSTLVFCVNVAHVHDLTRMFRLFNVDARCLHSSTTLTERKVMIESFRRGEYPVLVNCAILTEGADIPNIDCIIIARPTRSRNLFAQMVGRGMRLSPDTGKENCRVIDFVDALERMPGIVNTPSLLGLDPSELMDGKALRLRKATGGQTCIALDQTGNQVPDPSSVTFVDYNSLFLLANDASGTPPHITKLSRNSWVHCGNGTFILECLGQGHIKVEPIKALNDEPSTLYRASFSPNYNLRFKIAMNLAPFEQERRILDAATLEDAIHGCDTYASRNVLRGPLAFGLLRNAKWRHEPASENQRKWIMRRRGQRDAPVTSMNDRTLVSDGPNSLTKGDAAHIITRIKHGGFKTAR